VRVGRRRRIYVSGRRLSVRRRGRGHSAAAAAATRGRGLRGCLAGGTGSVAGAARSPAGWLIRRSSLGRLLRNGRIQIENLMANVFQERLGHAFHKRLEPFHLDRRISVCPVLNLQFREPRGEEHQGDCDDVRFPLQMERRL